MTAPPGVAFLSTVARLEEPREGDEVHPAAITFDAILPCRNNNAISPILCNARYIPRTRERVQQGNYQLFIQVTHNLGHPAPPNTHLS